MPLREHHTPDHKRSRSRCLLFSAIMEKPDWQRKILDETIVLKWKQEMLTQGIGWIDDEEDIQEVADHAIKKVSVHSLSGSASPSSSPNVGSLPHKERVVASGDPPCSVRHRVRV